MRNSERNNQRKNDRVNKNELDVLFMRNIFFRNINIVVFIISILLLWGIVFFKIVFGYNTYVDANEILDRMSLSVYGLSTYKCKVKIKADVINFGLSFSFDGEVYYKEPDKLLLKLKDLPEDIQEKYKLSFTQTSVPGMVSKIYKDKYKSKVLTIRDYGNKKVYVLYMEPIKSRAIKNVLMFVDSSNYTIPKSIIFYKDGGKITIDQKYQKIDKYYLPIYQEVNFDFPKVQAALNSTFYDYQLNLNLSDDLFKK